MRDKLLNATFCGAAVAYAVLCLGGCDGAVQAAADAAPEQWLKIADAPGGIGDNGLFVTHDLENGYICYVVRERGQRMGISCAYEGLMEDDAPPLTVEPGPTEYRL